MATEPIRYPLIFARGSWFTTRFIASRLGIDHSTVQKWCKRKCFLERRGCKVVNLSKGGKIWVYVPWATKDGLLSKVPIDITSLVRDTLTSYASNEGVVRGSRPPSL